jgi:hypothetical protein
MTVLVCLAAGIKPIITSSSDAKLAKLKKLSPCVHGINYNTSDVKAEVLKLTDGKGVDFIRRHKLNSRRSGTHPKKREYCACGLSGRLHCRLFPECSSYRHDKGLQDPVSYSYFAFR